MIERYLFFSQKWLEKFAELLNQNKAYEEYARTWTGDFVFIVRASGSLNHDVMAFIGLTHGKCTGVKSISGEDEFEVVGPDEKASSDDKIAVEYTFESDYDTWKLILSGELDPIRGLLAGKAKIAGDMAKVLKATDAAKELVRTAGMVDTEYY
ncbi:MAG: SCP2 sterol-binding domain-containing protein [Candidatus Thorarchaeota archaeon]